ncbi:MAG: DUF3168 domain-containing protein [Rhodobacteraceae bacterium]|nr:DUF3168 domain-containing protein [Paracoccaceae bacterium]
MSYAVTQALQAALFDLVANDPGVQGLIGAGVFDAPPSGVVPETYLVIGEEDVRVQTDTSGAVMQHDLHINIFSGAAGFARAKAVAVAVSDALQDAAPVLTRGRLVGLEFRRARARRGSRAGSRRIELIYRARVEDI